MTWTHCLSSWRGSPPCWHHRLSRWSHVPRVTTQPVISLAVTWQHHQFIAMFYTWMYAANIRYCNGILLSVASRQVTVIPEVYCLIKRNIMKYTNKSHRELYINTNWSKIHNFSVNQKALWMEIPKLNMNITEWYGYIWFNVAHTLHVLCWANGRLTLATLYTHCMNIIWTLYEHYMNTVRIL